MPKRTTTTTTTTNAPRVRNRNPKRRNASVRSIIQRITDPVLTDATSVTPSSLNVVSSTSGSTGSQVTIFARGLIVPTGAAGGGAYTTQETPHLPWLYSASTLYERFRVLSATLIFTPSVGSTYPGYISFESSVDASDFTLAGNPNFNSKRIPLSKETPTRIPLTVNSNWITSTPYSGQWFGSGGSSFIAPVNTLNDLLITRIAWVGFGQQTGSAQVLGTMVMEYQVQLDSPITSGLNQ